VVTVENHLTAAVDDRHRPRTADLTDHRLRNETEEEIPCWSARP
jgi:hypothetical protein